MKENEWTRRDLNGINLPLKIYIFNSNINIYYGRLGRGALGEVNAVVSSVRSANCPNFKTFLLSWYVLKRRYPFAFFNCRHKEMWNSESFSCFVLIHKYACIEKGEATETLPDLKMGNVMAKRNLYEVQFSLFCWGVWVAWNEPRTGQSEAAFVWRHRS